MTEPIETPPEPQPADDEPMSLGEARKLRREHASLRQRLHEKDEQIRDKDEQLGAAAAVVSAYQLAEVKRVAGEVLHDPDDLLAHQPDMTVYFDAEFAGMVNADNVVEQAKELIRQRPHLGKPQTAPPPTDRPIESLRPGASPAGEKTTAPTWAQALRGQ